LSKVQQTIQSNNIRFDRFYRKGVKHF